jgi:enoyl-CoA hydratase/carnithine racemase
LDLITTGRLVTGVEALAMGLVTRVVDDPLMTALSVAHSIADRSPNAMKQTKRLLRMSESASLVDGMREELRVMSTNIGSPAQVEATRRYFAARGR